jgi:hypothetical protein
MREYRDKFLAHLDNRQTMNIPRLDKALAAVQFCHAYLTNNEAQPGDLADLPATEADYQAYYDHCIQEATRVYQQIDQA